ncbi:uncharacterized protein N7515_000321 [Penicillium bovifimosum]|uniref:Uncharacterized protein n=1 Tax=Penicillium bovifimosum TaxID=126998 RepID=A0A9W9HHT3_9EURO|nr:uncharacterized protein N7515_000321 [Penicillium bovifimosum]KAJ5145757.1 hypothetical protein N7515_000321 [Penicillium bovifimosum]
MNLKSTTKGCGTPLASVIRRDLPWRLVDELENFILVLRNWNKLNHHEILNGDYTFDLDALPVKFYRSTGSLRVHENESPESELNAAMRYLTEIIWKEGGFRFTPPEATAPGLQNSTYTYHCSQDAMHTKGDQSTEELEKQRDGRRMDRFPCESQLNIRPCLQRRTLSVSIHHIWHMPAEPDISNSESESFEIASESSGFESESDSDYRESEGESEPDAKPFHVRAAEYLKMMREFIEHFDEEKANGNFE